MTPNSEPMEGTGKLFDAMWAFFQKDEWPTIRVEGQTAATANFQGQNGRWGVLARSDEDKELLLFYSYCPIKIDEAKRPIIADFITRANYGLYVGNFEMDFNDGEVRYKTSVDVEGSEPTFDLIKRLVYNNVGVMDRYLPGIMAVNYGGDSPQAAIAKVEMPIAPPASA